MEKIQVLFLSGEVEDMTLLSETLRHRGFDFISTTAGNEQAFITAITHQDIDVILACKTHPQFTPIHALNLLSSVNKHIPLIFIAEDIAKDNAINILKAGAYDCLSINDLGTLPAAIIEAIEKHWQKTEHSKHINNVIANEALLSDAAQLARLGSWETDLVNNTERWSDEQYRILWMKPGETEPALGNLIRKVHPEDVMAVTQTISEAIRHHDRQRFDCRIVNNDGQLKYISVEMALKRDPNGKLLRINGCLWDVTDMRMTEQNEKRMLSDLVQRNKDLEQFAYIISHNLRAPVANIVGVSNTLFEGNLEKEEEQEFIGALSTSVKKLDNIITDLNHILQVKRHVNENMEMVNFGQMVEDIKSSIGIFLEDQLIMIITDFEEVQEMHTLKSYMRSIFYNLISNSIKYRKPELAPVIEIKSRRYKDKVEITFKDNSIGIDLHTKKDQIFGLYKRFHPEHAEGKGMGLFMVKTQVETLGGKISVQSKVNEGTEFKIVFENQKTGAA